MHVRRDDHPTARVCHRQSENRVCHCAWLRRFSLAAEIFPYLRSRPDSSPRNIMTITYTVNTGPNAVMPAIADHVLSLYSLVNLLLLLSSPMAISHHGCCKLVGSLDISRHMIHTLSH